VKESSPQGLDSFRLPLCNAIGTNLLSFIGNAPFGFPEPHHTCPATSCVAWRSRAPQSYFLIGAYTDEQRSNLFSVDFSASIPHAIPAHNNPKQAVLLIELAHAWIPTT
jgi:hypothetical protein